MSYRNESYEGHEHRFSGKHQIIKYLVVANNYLPLKTKHDSLPFPPHHRHCRGIPMCLPRNNFIDVGKNVGATGRSPQKVWWNKLSNHHNILFFNFPIIFASQQSD